MPLITNNGDHSAETLAMHTADVLFPNSQEWTRNHEIDAAKLRLAIGEALVGHHTAVKGDPEQDSAHAAGEALAAIQAACAGTPWAEEFTTDEGARRALGVLTTHFNTTAYNARRYAAG